jgi:uncharacterized protein (TIGR03083 family)
MDNQLQALRSSVQHLRDVVSRIDPSKFESPAYPSEWSVADVLSHIGSGAVILKHRVEDLVKGAETDGGFNQSVWDEWNAKAPAAQVTDGLAADAALLECLDSLTGEQREGLKFQMGPMTLDFAGVVVLRLNEHVLHTWDVEVTFEPSATLPVDEAAAVVDNLQMIVKFAGKPSGQTRAWNVQTTDPIRTFTISFGPESVELSAGPLDGAGDLELPAESLVRLVYGRLDPDHTPSSVDGRDLDELRQAFPGF